MKKKKSEVLSEIEKSHAKMSLHFPRRALGIVKL